MQDDPLSRKRARTGLAIAMQTPSAVRAADHAQPMDTPMLLSTATKDRCGVQAMVRPWKLIHAHCAG